MKTFWTYQVVIRFARNVENGGDMPLVAEFDTRRGFDNDARDYAEITATEYRRRFGWVVDHVVVVGRETVSTKPGIVGRGVVKYVSAKRITRHGTRDADPTDPAVVEMVDAAWQQRGRAVPMLPGTMVQ